MGKKLGKVEIPFGIVYTRLFVNLAHDRHSGVDRVSDDEHVSLGANLGSSCGQISHNGGIGLVE